MWSISVGPPLATSSAIDARQFRGVAPRGRLGQLGGARRGPPVVLAHAKDVVPPALTLLHAPLDLAGLPQGHADLGHDQPHGTRGAGHGRHHRVGPAVLRRDDVAIGGQVPECQLSRPRRVVHLHGDECDLVIARQAGRLVEVDGGGARFEGLVRPGHRQAALSDGLDLLGPGIDERHVVSGARQEGPEVASDGPGADEEKSLTHGASRESPAAGYYPSLWTFRPANQTRCSGSGCALSTPGRRAAGSSSGWRVDVSGSTAPWSVAATPGWAPPTAPSVAGPRSPSRRPCGSCRRMSTFSSSTSRPDS